MCLITSGTARRSKGVSKWIVWRCSVFSSESDAVLHRSTDCGSRVDGGVLYFVTNKMESSSRAGQVALGHLFTISMLELPRVVRRVLGGLTLGRAGSDPDAPTRHDAVHGLRAAPEPDATVCETFEVSQFVALVK